jgi:endogenous inhibitor of DNA gyrase (YacG/DUF329 family)
MVSAPKLVSCPQCGRASPYCADNPFRPFCSERCKLMDLGAWASEDYRVAVKTPDQSTDNETPPDS